MPQTTRLRTGAIVQKDIIYALFMREILTRFGRHNIGFLWLFLEPLMLGTAVGCLHSFSGHALPGHLDPFVFSILGYIPFFMFRSIINRSPTALEANLSLLYHQHVSLTDVMLARNLLEFMACGGVITLTVLFLSFFAGYPPEDPLLIIVGVILIGLLSNGLSMIFAAAGVKWEVFDRFVHPATYIFMPISGAFFALSWFTQDTRDMLLWIPNISIHEIIRSGQFGEALPGYYDLQYVLIWIVLTNFFGLLSLRAVKSQIH